MADQLNGEITPIEVPLYEEVKLHTNCTVQVLKNKLTGELSVGWWENDSITYDPWRGRYDE